MRYRGAGGGELRKDWRDSPLVLPSEALEGAQQTVRMGDVIFLQGTMGWAYGSVRDLHCGCQKLADGVLSRLCWVAKLTWDL